MDVQLVRARAVIDRAIASRVLPGAAIEVGHRAGVMAGFTAGHLTYAPDSPAVSAGTVYDIASLTKVIATAALVLELVERGDLALDEPVAGRIVRWTGADRQDVTVADLLEHAAGLPAHRRYFEDHRGRLAFERLICAEPLEYLPRTQSIYTDLGFILLGFMLEDAIGLPLHLAFASWRDRQIGPLSLTYLPPPDWRAAIAPTEYDGWRGRLLVGEVHDENAAALDGVAGHAGLFGTAAAVGACARWWLERLDASPIARRFATRSRVPGSSRALGWDTMLPSSSCGTRFSESALGHTGFTGTSLWIDPYLDRYVVCLANRVHPARAGDGMQEVRRALHDAVDADLTAHDG